MYVYITNRPLAIKDLRKYERLFDGKLKVKENLEA
jgi:hypothetical protein